MESVNCIGYGQPEEPQTPKTTPYHQLPIINPFFACYAQKPDRLKQYSQIAEIKLHLLFSTKERWEEMLKTVREPLGKVISRQVISKMPTRTVPGGPDGEYVIIQFKTSFENKKDAIETVTPMLDNSGVWRVSGYYIK